MWGIIPLNSCLHKKIYTVKINPKLKDESPVADRQILIPGFNQPTFEDSWIIQVGAGGLGSEIGEGTVRKGIGRKTIYDSDIVEISNLNRQHFFKRDLYKKKGVRLAVNLAKHATCGTVIEGYGYSFQDAVALGHDLAADVIICGVDNNATRLAVAEYYLKLDIPVIFMAVDYFAESGYVFVQEPGGPCFACAFYKSIISNRKAPCRTPAVKDILKVVAGLGLYAVDSLLMDRKRNWNYRLIHLAGFAPSLELMIEKRDNCSLCGKIKSH